LGGLLLLVFALRLCSLPSALVLSSFFLPAVRFLASWVVRRCMHAFNGGSLGVYVVVGSRDDEV